MPLDPDDSLFQPTLSAEDDTIGIHEPWNPFYILFVTFFFGFIAGAILFWQNAARLGMPRYPRVSVALCALYLAIFGTATVLFTLPESAIPMADRLPDGYLEQLAESRQSGTATDNSIETMFVKSKQKVRSLQRDRRRMIEAAMTVIALGIALTWYLPQKKRFRLSEGRGIATGTMWRRAIVASVVGYAVQAAVLLPIGIYALGAHR